MRKRNSNKTQTGLLLILLGMQLGAEPTEEPDRIWSGNTENRVEGKFQKELFGDILVKDTSGENHLIRFEQLSPADLTYIGYHILPTVEIDVDFETELVPRTEYTRPDDQTLIYTFAATVEKKSKLPYRSRMNAEFFVIARERTVSDDSRFVLMSYNRQSFELPVEKKSQCELTFPDVLFMTYRADWAAAGGAGQVERGKTFLGTLLSVSSPDGEIIAMETDIRVRWLTADLPQNVEKLRQLYRKHSGHFESRHFNREFEKLEPPRIRWFQRNPDG
jgi:hypothetical protein